MPPRIAPRKEVPIYLAEWRKHLGFTQQQVAEALASPGTDKTTISRYETDRRGLSLDAIAAYAEALSRLSGRTVRPADLYRRPNEEQSLDELVARAPKHLREIARAQIEVLLKRDR